MISGQIPNYERPSLMKRFRDEKSFSSRLIEPEKLLCILEAGRQSSSYNNEQPWSFVITTKSSVDHAQLIRCLAAGNATWAADAPVLILSVAKVYFESDGSKNGYAFHDLAGAVSNITSKAKALGIVTHSIAGFDATLARETFEIPSGYVPVSVLVLGYPKDGQLKRIDAEQGGEQARRPLESVAFSGVWGRPLASDRKSRSPIDSCQVC
ncbi:MAG TPA: nitroreductase family protein [Blastocatellia bacterium]|nr:nitroreductase family protein [Blastocatellia bacterium]